VIKKGSLFTKIIDRDPSVGESSGGLVGVEISSIRKMIGTCEGSKEIVGSAIDGGVSDDEQRRHQRRRRCS